MSRATVELDLFGIEKQNSCKSQFQKFLDRRRSFRGIQGAISKMNPELIKSVIASGLTSKGQDSVHQIDSNKPFSVPKEAQGVFPTFPETVPFTIFYNGTVSVFNVSPDKAERILKLAVEESSKNVESTDSKVANPFADQQLLQTLNGDLPIARRKSLQRFLEKRKDRLTSVSPYA